MVSWDVRHIRLSGGEPTYHRQFRDVIDACEHRAISISINSHGVYSASLLAYLKTASIDLFIISMDGLKSNNDAIRGQGTFRRALHSCQQLRQAEQRVMIGFHVGVDNRTDVSGLITLAAEIGVDIKIAPIRPVGRAADQLPDALLQPRAYLEVVAEATRLRQEFPHIKILTDFDILDEATDIARRHDPITASCKAGRTMININYDGGIYPCAFFVTPSGKFCAGNIYEDSVTDVWRNSPIFRPFRIHQKSNICRACKHYQARCFGGCPAIAHFTKGYLDAHDPTCFAGLAKSIGSVR
jgi:radical SAM protein with 4Fe4S-binding SPASM domain